MAILQNACCCCTLRLGSLIIGILYVVLHIIDLGVVAGIVLGRGAYGTDIAAIVVDAFAIFFGLLLIVGVLMTIMALLRTWVVLAIVLTIIELIILIVFTAMVLAGVWTASASSSPWLVPVIVAWIIFYFIFYVTIYGAFVVYSHYQSLRDGEYE